MTDEMMSLRGVLEKSADVDLLREMIGVGAERLMQLEVGSLPRIVRRGIESSAKLGPHRWVVERTLA